MGQALYRKYRPKKLADAVGQDHITATLTSAIRSGQIRHAYLLTGPKGVGKTSIARILAHEFNGLPYDDTAHLDIIEIDAASNRRIDEIRDLRDRVNTAPASATYKVYIIDEVHMLTKEAFNALLKTLEEPPAHVIFILATTEAHKLPDTIVSRTQHFSFRPVPEAQVVEHLKGIAKQEKIKIDDDALGLVARHGKGSFRDSIGLLDQLGGSGEAISRHTVEALLGIVSDDLINRLVSAVETSNSATVVELLTQLQGQGFEPVRIAQQVAAVIRRQILAGDSSLSTQTALSLLKDLLAVPAARDQMALLELTLLTTTLAAAVPVAAPTPVAVTVQPAAPARAANAVTPAQSFSPAAKQQPAEKPAASSNDSTAPLQPATPAAPAAVEAKLTVRDAAPDTALPVSTLTLDIDITTLWKQVLDDIKKQYNTLYGIARMAKPTLDGQTLTLAFTFAFHQKRVNESKNRKLLADTVSRLSGQTIDILCTVEVKPAAADGATVPADKPQDLSAISTIFGGGELLES